MPAYLQFRATKMNSDDEMKGNSRAIRSRVFAVYVYVILCTCTCIYVCMFKNAQYIFMFTK